MKKKLQRAQLKEQSGNPIKTSKKSKNYLTGKVLLSYTMVDFDTKELLKLSPPERVKKLKEIQKKQEEELEESKKLLKTSEQELQERANSEQQERVKSDQAALELEDRAFQRQLEQSLEEQVKDARPLPPEHKQVSYDPSKYVVNLYSTLKNAMDSGIPLNPMEKKRVADMYPNSSLSENEIKNITVATKAIVAQIMGSYYADIKYSP